MLGEGDRQRGLWAHLHYVCAGMVLTWAAPAHFYGPWVILLCAFSPEMQNNRQNIIKTPQTLTALTPCTAGLSASLISNLYNTAAEIW